MNKSFFHNTEKNSVFYSYLRENIYSALKYHDVSWEDKKTSYATLPTIC